MSPRGGLGKHESNVDQQLLRSFGFAVLQVLKASKQACAAARSFCRVHCAASSASSVCAVVSELDELQLKNAAAANSGVRCSARG